MRKSLAPQFVAAVFLAFISGSSMAATVDLIGTFINNHFAPNDVSSHFCASNDPSCDEDIVQDAELRVTDPDGVSGSSSVNHSYFSPSNITGAPNFVYEAFAFAKALPGSLHASVAVELNGTGGDVVGGDGLSATSLVRVTDELNVTSSTLASGTLVTLNVLVDIGGKGRARAGVTVVGNKPGFGLTNLFREEASATTDQASLSALGGQFSAQVGGRLFIEYFLQASAGVRDSNWKQEDVENGRAADSDYGNSAFLYFSATDPANVTLKGQSGYDYVQPNPVPLPAAVWSLLSGLLLLTRRRV